MVRQTPQTGLHRYGLLVLACSIMPSDAKKSAGAKPVWTMRQTRSSSHVLPEIHLLQLRRPH